MAASLVGERWNILILRELLAGARYFNDIHRGLPGLSRTLLSQRLKTMTEAGLVLPSAQNLNRKGYILSAKGHDLEFLIKGLGAWSVRWGFPEPTEQGLDPRLLLWRMRAALAIGELPSRRIAIELLFDQRPQPFRGWLVLAGHDSTACVRHPMFQIDLYARATTIAWHELWYGHRTWKEVLNGEDLVLAGEADLVAAFPSWFDLSPFAEQVAANRDPAATDGTR